jgi:hypothetical protein
MTDRYPVPIPDFWSCNTEGCCVRPFLVWLCAAMRLELHAYACVVYLEEMGVDA